MLIKILKTTVLALALTLLISCGNEEKTKNGKPIETMNSGTFTVYCEEGLWDMMKTPFEWYDEDYDKAFLTAEKTTTYDAMAKLLSANARVIVIARDYTHREDSLMKAYGVKDHLRFTLAKDGLVFFAQKDFPIDTITAEKMQKYFTAKESSFSDLYPEVDFTPEFVINSHLSSEYFNLQKMVAGKKKLARNLKFFQSHDSVLTYVSENPQAVGIGYLHYLYDKDFKMLKVGYVDSTGKYIKAKPVHQGWIVQGYYPYTVPLYAYLLEDRRNLPFWFATFLAKETKVQEYFMDSGIVPEFARIALVPEQ